jgi:transcriptional regulator with XRE-family HTH domain
MENSTVNDRIKTLVEHFSAGNKSAFARAAGISNQSLAEILGARQSAPSFAALQKILTAFPQVRMEWFIFGRGPMLQEKVAPVTLDPFAGLGGAHKPFISEEVALTIEQHQAEERKRLSTLIDVLIKRDPALGNELQGLLFESE